MKDKGCSLGDNNAHILDREDNWLNDTFFMENDVHFPEKDVFGKYMVFKNTNVRILTKTCRRSASNEEGVLFSWVHIVLREDNW